jgi:hypothetical protein
MRPESRCCEFHLAQKAGKMMEDTRQPSRPGNRPESMSRRMAISLSMSALLLAAPGVLPQTGVPSPSDGLGQLDVSAPPPTAAEIRDRRLTLLANQHADDEALNQYERIERHITRTGAANPRILEDKTYRVVPTGGGTMKILLEDRGARVSPAEYRRQLQSWEDILEMMVKPDDPKAQSARAKYAKRERQRAEFLEATKDAFVPKWLGRQMYSGRSCDVFELAPNPEFHPHSIFQSALAHVTAKIWVDRSANQIIRGEAWVMSDISFVGGIAGKVYRGSVVEMDQAEVTPGVWLPTHYQYDFAGRKFVFPFEEHQVIEVRNYHRIGPPSDALARVQSELASGKTLFADP